jgi:hypothetical protein
MTASERVEYESEVDRLRGLLGSGALGTAWAEGRSMTVEAAVSLAVSGDASTGPG